MLPSGLTLNSEDQFCCPYDTTLIQASGPERGSNSAAAHDFRSSGPPLFGLHGYLGTAPKAGSKLDFLTYFFILPAGEAVPHTMRLPSSTIYPPLEGPQRDLNMVSIGDQWPQSPRPRRCQGLAPCRRGWTILPPPSAEAAPCPSSAPPNRVHEPLTPGCLANPIIHLCVAAGSKSAATTDRLTKPRTCIAGRSCHTSCHSEVPLAAIPNFRHYHSM
jgi:hypothetical protein